MKLLPEFAVLLDVFEGPSEVTRLRAAHLRDTVLREALVRDLHGGRWFRALQEYQSTQDGTTRKILGELLKALKTGRRLTRGAACSDAPPADPSEWIKEAIASHQRTPLDAILTGATTGTAASGRPVVSVDELLLDGESYRPVESVRVKLQTADYVAHLAPILRHAGRICFIDPYLNPKHSDYRAFPELILQMQSRTQKPRIELHLKYRQGETAISEQEEWKSSFSDWDARFRTAKIPVRVRVWNDFHNRYLLSDLIGLHVGKGFRTTTDSKAFDDWSRLGRKGRLDVDAEFDSNSSDHKLICDFTIGIS